MVWGSLKGKRSWPGSGIILLPGASVWPLEPPFIKDRRIPGYQSLETAQYIRYTLIFYHLSFFFATISPTVCKSWCTQDLLGASLCTCERAHVDPFILSCA